jgi:glycine/D-amino acid oxidase-like deaminating enzyme
VERPPRAVLEQVGVETVGTGKAGHSAGRSVASIFSLVTAAGSSSLGSTFLPDEPDPRSLAPVLRDRGARFVPAIADAPIRSVRACARPQSLDGRPLLGPVPWLENVYVAAGHGPWGISLGPGSARLVADLILGRNVTVPPALRADRFGRSVSREARG